MVSKNKKEKGSNKILILGSSLSMKVSQILEPKKQKTPIFSEEKRGLKDFRIIPFPPGNGIEEPKSTAIIARGDKMSSEVNFCHYPEGDLVWGVGVFLCIPSPFQKSLVLGHLAKAEWV
jgi:hypothetical protein